jgi:hypothetical protein
MQTRENVRLGSGRDRKDELIGVLYAISIVSKRLAKRLTALNRAKTKGARIHDPEQSRPIRK